MFKLEDEAYKKFQSGLIPSIDSERVIGVRTPELRKLAKEISKSPLCERFLKELPHKYFEENQLHAFIISGMKDYDECIGALSLFLPYVDNWATCDQMSPKIFKKYRKNLLGKIKIWILSEEEYTVRFGIKMLMDHFLDEDFDKEYLDLVADIRSDKYYINMMIAWYFATALAKQYDDALPYIEKRRLEAWTHNKAIQKSVESYRISDEKKEYLKSLKVKSRL
ncbi:MAG: DNA alkylation repair protein [Eubacterium sp.]|nr:DNA alkylation repair protein [Eubacterium sp.]